MNNRKRPNLTEMLNSAVAEVGSENMDPSLLQKNNYLLEAPTVLVGHNQSRLRAVELERKDTRVRSDQLLELELLRKTLIKRRLIKGERITDNTLIRIALDLLLARKDELHGDNETELRQSMGLS